MINQIGRYISFIVNIICCIIMFIIPNALVKSIEGAGYSGDMFSAIYGAKVIVYSLILIIIMVSVSKFFDSFDKNKKN